MSSIARQPNETSAAVKSQTIPDDPEATSHPAAAPKAEAVPPLPIQPVMSPDLHVIKRLFWVLAVIAVAVALYAGSAVFIPLIAALLLSFLFKPVVRHLESWGVIPPVSALLIMGVLFVAIVGGAASAADALRAWMDGLPQATRELEFKFRDLRSRFHQVTEVTTQITDMASGEESPDAEAPTTSGPAAPPPRRKPVEVEIRGSTLPSVVMSRTATIIASLTVTLVMAFFMLASGDLLLRQLVQSLPELAHKKGAVEAWRDLESHVSAYLATVTLINVGLGLAVWLVLWLLGLPNAMWWGVAAALGNYIPYIGPLLVAAAVFLASVLAFDSLGQATVPPLAFVALTSIEGYFITPMVVGRRLSLNPLVLFVWLVFWGWMWGVAGALMAVPMLVCFKIVCDRVESLHTLADVLSGYVRRAGEGNGSTPAPAAEKSAA